MTTEVWFAVFATWLSFVVIAALIGGLGAGHLAERFGSKAAQQIDAVIIVALAYGLTLMFVRGHEIDDVKLLFGIGAAWALMTLVLELIVGHFLVRQSWARLLRFYKARTGRLYFALLIVLFFVPYIASLQVRALSG